jgi:hypothetical protein
MRHCEAREGRSNPEASVTVLSLDFFGRLRHLAMTSVWCDRAALARAQGLA